MHFEDPSPQKPVPGNAGAEPTPALPAAQASDTAPAQSDAQLSANVSESHEATASEPAGADPSLTHASASIDTAPAAAAEPPAPVVPLLPIIAPRGGPRRAAEPAPKPAPSTGRRFGLLAASIAIAAGIGAAAGAAGVAGVSRLMATPAPAPAPVAAAPTPVVVDNSHEIKTLRETVAQMRGSLKSLNDAIGALKVQADGANKGTQAQIAKLTDAVDKLERAQAEPKARLAKLSESLDKLERRTAAAAPQPVMPADTTGSVRPIPLPPLHKPPIEGWSVRDVYEGIALVRGRLGTMEVAVGDEIRGLGRVQDIRRQEGRWVVVTTKGVIR